MGIKEMTSGIKALQANALQDYLIIILNENNISLSKWKEQYALFVEGQHKKNINSVAEVYKKIALNGIESIDIKQLDTSAIINYVRFGKLIYKNKEEKKKTEWYLCLLQEDRNIDAHVHGNEKSYEIYQFAVITLGHMMSFVDYVWNDRKGEVSEGRYNYTKKYKTKVSQALLELDQCYRKEVIGSERKSRFSKNILIIFYSLLIALGFLVLAYWIKY